MIERYYNLFDPAKHYTQLLFRAGDGLQSRELNEIQTTLIHRLQGVADALLKDGDIVSGANLQIDADILPLTHGVFSWFQFGGNTFVVQDNTNADGFANTADVVVALTGLVNLTTATLGNKVITLGLQNADYSVLGRG